MIPFPQSVRHAESLTYAGASLAKYESYWIAAVVLISVVILR
jgi:hypothetical protein